MAVTGDRSLEWEASIGTEQLEADARKIEEAFARITASANRESAAQITFIERIGAAQTSNAKEQIEAITQIREQLRLLSQMQTVAPSDNITEAIKATEKELQRLLDLGKGVFSELGKAAGDFSKTMSQIEIKPIISETKAAAPDDTAKREQLALQAALKQSREAYAALKAEQANQRLEQELSRVTAAEARQEIDRLSASEKELTAQYRAGKLSVSEYVFEQKKIGDALREQVRVQKESERALKEQVRQQKEQEQQAERNRKQLEKESSEYHQLSKALGNLRSEAKEVQAEMFRLQREGKNSGDAYRQLEERSKSLTKQTQILDQGVKQIDASLGLHQRNVGNYGQAIENLSPMFGRINQQLAGFGTSITALASGPNPFQALTTALVGFGRAALAFMVTPIGAIITALAGMYALISANKKTVLDFNAGLIGVQKTAGDSIPDMEAFGDAVVDMSSSLKTVSSKELLEYAKTAGQLGVKGTQDILKFSEALAKLSIASDISGEEGAADIARLLTLTDGGVGNIQEFGSEIVNLGNNFAATEKEILHNATRIAQSTGIYKVGRQEVLAYATATKAVGLEAQVVGSSLGRTFGALEKAIRTGDNIDTFAKLAGKSVDDLKKAFKQDASGVFQDFIGGLNKVNAAGGSVNGMLEQLSITSVEDQRVIASLAVNGYDTLTRAMEKVRNSGGSLDEEFQAANKSLENVGKRIGIAWDNLVLSIENGQGVFAQVGSYIGNEFANFLDSTKRVIDSFGAAFNVLGQYFDDLSPSMKKTSDQALVFGDTFESIRLLFENFSIRGFLEFFIVDIPNAFRAAGSYVDIFVADFKAFVNFVATTAPELGKYLRDAVNPMATASSDNLEKLLKDFTRRSRQNTQFILDDTKKANAEALRLFNERYDKQKQRVSESERQLKDSKGKELTDEEIAELQRIGEARRKANDERLAAQRALQGKIDELNNKAHRKELSQSEAELQAIRDKYAKIRQEVDAFYKNPKNQGLKVDTSGLDASFKKEMDEAKAKQEVETLKGTIAQQKQLYEQFEAYKLEYGLDKANQRFDQELADYESYTAYLKSLMPDEKDMSVEAVKTRELVEPLIKKEKDDQSKKQLDQTVKNFKEIIKVTNNANLERTRIEEQYQKDVGLLQQELAGEANAEELQQRLAMLDQRKEQELASVKQLAFEEGELYRKMMQDITFMSTDELKERVRELNRLLQNPDLTPLERNTIEQAKSNALQYGQLWEDAFGNIVNDADPLAKKFRKIEGAAQEIANSFAGLAEIMAGVNEGLSATLVTMGALVQVGADAAGSIASFASGNIAGGITQGIKAIAGLFNIFKSSRESARQAREQVDAFYESVKAGEREYQAMLRQRELDNLRRHKDSVANIKKEQELLKAQQRDVVAEFEKTLAELQKQQFIAGQKTEKFGGFLGIGRKTRVVDVMGSLAGTSYEELERLYKENLLKDKAKADFEELRKLKEELKEIGYSLQDLQDQYNAVFTGGATASSIGSTIIEGFKQGKRAVEDFAGDAEDIIRNALLSALNYKYLQGPLEKLIEKFANDATSGEELTQEEIDAFTKQYNEIIAAGLKIVEEVEKATGTSLSSGSAAEAAKSQDPLAGAFRTLTEDTANVLAGRMNGVQISNLQILEATNKVVDVGQQSLAMIQSGLGELRLIELNTRGIAVTNEYLKITNERLTSMDRKMDSTNDILRANGG